MKPARLPDFLLVAALLCSTACDRGDRAPSAPPPGPVTFLSTQMTPAEEAEKLRNVILKGYPGSVDFRPIESARLSGQVSFALAESPQRAVLIAAVHGDLVRLGSEGLLAPLPPLGPELEHRAFQDSLMKLGRPREAGAGYLPWMQASFVMLANRKALPYLPKGADIKNLSYDELLEWGEAIHAQTGRKALGLPLGDRGLVHRFFEGYLYPSFTGSSVRQFRSPEAVVMWSYFRRLWNSVYPGSVNYVSMSDPLLSGDVWLAWDHTARLAKAFQEEPGDFVAFPAPVGPKGRGYMAIIVGLGVPRASTDLPASVALMEYLTRPAVQETILKETGFFPVISPLPAKSLPAGLRELAAAVSGQSSTANSILSLAPIGLGSRSGEFDRVYTLTFSSIVLQGEDIQTVLDANAGKLRAMIADEGLKAWPPDDAAGAPFTVD